ncbi:hypothetical protein AB4235_19825, partial [Vibrio cyclitrophicus]
SRYRLELKSEIDDTKATLTQDYITKVQSGDDLELAISQLKTEMTSDIDGISSNLKNNYYTGAVVDGNIRKAVTEISTELGASLDDLESNLDQRYYTKTQTDGQVTTAVSNASQTLQSSIDGVDSRVTTVSNTAVNTKGEFEALWGVKTSVGDTAASVGLVAKSDGSGVDDAYFFVKDADFKVLYSDGAADKQAAIFGTVVDPEDPTKRVLSIDTTYINAANIKDIVAGDIVADSIVAGSEIHTPVLRSPVINQEGANFHVNESGIASMKGANINGTLNGVDGVFSGSLNVRSASSGSRIEILTDRINVYNGSSLRVRIGKL